MNLFMVFRVGVSVNDIKSFKWAITDNGLVYVDNRSDHEVVFRRTEMGSGASKSCGTEFCSTCWVSSTCP